jgi:predicted DNA-binding protein with PD1-like motif
VGSVTRAALRYANQKESAVQEGHFEVVSLVGTIGSTSGEHLHMSVSDEHGVTTGGHLMPGSVVYTTLEVAILSLEDRTFVRVPDPLSGFDELQIEERV